MTIHKGYGVAIKPTGASTATLIGGVETQEFTSNSTHLTQITSGQGSPQSVSVSAVKPRMTFSSYQIGALLDLLGVKGACLSGGAVPGFEMYELDTDACGAIRAGTNHRKIIAPNGRVVPRTLSCNHEADAQLACEVIPIFDGTNLPVIVTGSVAAPTGLADTERFTLGPITLMDLPITFVQSISIDFGNQVETVGGDGDIYPKNVDIQNFGPTITITCLDVGQFAAAKIKLDGIALAHDDTSLVLRRRVNATGSFSAEADSLELTCAGVASVQSVSASGNQPKTMQILITCIHDGTNEPIVAATDHDLTPA
jgi:hypothetical protein